MSEASTTYQAKHRTPFAVLGLRTDGRALTRLTYLPHDEDEAAPADAIAARAVRELERYLADPEFRFTVPRAPGGTPFQQRVWDAICAIPPGQSRTYGEVARMVRSAPRAVGQACGANRIALIIPCHRVVGAMGALGGFMGAAGPGGADTRAAAISQQGLPFGAELTLPNIEPGDADPPTIKRWLLVHEGYRFGA